MPQLTLAQAFARAPQKSSPEKQQSKSPPKPSTSDSKPPSKILFGPNGPHAEFDQFAVHAITYNGVVYPTSQHLFQALKFIGHRMDIAELIRSAATAQLALAIAHSNKTLSRADWFQINLTQMEEVLFLKFSQYNHLKQELLSTDSSQLYQDSMTDSFWGVGPDLLGCNEFGRALERVRERLGGPPASVHTASPCLKCSKKPRYGESLYCGPTCLRADISRVAPMCPEIAMSAATANWRSGFLRDYVSQSCWLKKMTTGGKGKKIFDEISGYSECVCGSCRIRLQFGWIRSASQC